MARTTPTETPLRVAFQAAAGPAVGGGHVVRSISLANALAAQGASCAFFVDDQTVKSTPLLSRSGHALVPHSGHAAPIGHGAFDWTVVDDYGLSAADETVWRAVSRKILVLDDLANRRHDCDLVVDSTPSRRAEAYAALVPAGARLLLGPAYAPLRSEFALRRPEALARREATVRPSRLLVSFGLMDPGGITARAVLAISKALPDLAMDVVLGPMTPSFEALKALGSPNITVHCDPPSMPDLMIAADLALGAGGSTAWERAALGLPSVVLILADNQRALAQDLAQRGALSALAQKEDWPAVIAALKTLTENREAWHAMSRRAALVCDGRGANRVALEMNPPLSRPGLPVRLRPATDGDTDRIFQWQSAPGAREFSSNPRSPAREEHEAWMARKLDEPRCVFNIITEDDVPAGVLRLDQRLDGSFMTSILVADDARNRGIAGAALKAGAQLMQGTDLWARIDPRNTASLRSFAKAGFLPENGVYRRAHTS
jgi:UDP-2,4-diacetamido-2,4,6-trideoxy-beta-L-altropyranose hydrolase